MHFVGQNKKQPPPRRVQCPAKALTRQCGVYAEEGFLLLIHGDRFMFMVIVAQLFSRGADYIIRN